jgi:hypothetical protein
MMPESSPQMLGATEFDDGFVVGIGRPEIQYMPSGH